MKALFSRFNRSPVTRETGPKDIALIPPLPVWPPPPREAQPPSPAPSPAATLPPAKPLPDLSFRPLPPIVDPSQSPISLQAPPEPAESTGTSIRRTVTSNGSILPGSINLSSNATNGDGQRKVAFLSPPATAVSPPPPAADERKKAGPLDVPPAKTSVARFTAQHSQDPRGSTSSAGAQSKVSVTSAKQASLRPSVASPTRHLSVNNEAASLRSGTPFSTASARTGIMATASWSETAEEDLVMNLGQRERTRQEVLWEIVASEERYVAELVKLKDTFIDPLLHPFAASPMGSPQPDGDDFYETREDTPAESLDHLPIASRFLSPTTVLQRSEAAPTPPQPTVTWRQETPVIPPADGESVDTDEDEAGDRMGESYSRAAAAKHNHPRSPYGTAARRGAKPAVPFPSRSHHSLPPPPRPPQLAASTASLGRQTAGGGGARLMSDPDRRAAAGSPASRVLRKLQKRQQGPGTGNLPGGALPPHLLPEDLRQCLEVLESSILSGHRILAEGLRKRYEEQYPLVRSLADVFVANSHILHGYATYVLHLERALEQVDDALSSASVMKRPKKQDAAEWAKLSKFLMHLEEVSAERGETGLAISLSKPFQRLLKYPLLFQNLLFHTDPSTFEYESTLQMVAEVENIVRSIEDEKIQKEERDRTRDVFARIEGLDKVKMLALPKPSRLLVEEKTVAPDTISENGPTKGTSSPPPVTQNRTAVKNKTSFKRLSDVLTPSALSSGSSNGVGGKKDLWLVVFNDVVLRCQRTGTTTLPIVSTTTTMSARTSSMPDLQAKPKYATASRRASQGKPRNLYKFIKIETWDIGDASKPREGVVQMDQIERTRAISTNGSAPPIAGATAEEEEGVESDDSDRKSKMSFSYWGADRVTLTTPRPKPGTVSRGTTRGGPVGSRRPQVPSSYGHRESSAQAKFGTRLVSSPEGPSGSGSVAQRPASRRTQVTRRTAAPSDEGGTSMRSTQTPIIRPAWSGSTRTTPAGTVSPPPIPTTITSAAPVTKRVRTVSAGAVGLRNKTSEDSGIGLSAGLYRQLVAHDPSLKGQD